MVSTSPLRTLYFFDFMFSKRLGRSHNGIRLGELAVVFIIQHGSICVGRLASIIVCSLPCTLAGVNTFVGFDGNPKGVVCDISVSNGLT